MMTRWRVPHLERFVLTHCGKHVFITSDKSVDKIWKRSTLDHLVTPSVVHIHKKANKISYHFFMNIRLFTIVSASVVEIVADSQSEYVNTIFQGCTRVSWIVRIFGASFHCWDKKETCCSSCWTVHLWTAEGSSRLSPAKFHGSVAPSIFLVGLAGTLSGWCHNTSTFISHSNESEPFRYCSTILEQINLTHFWNVWPLLCLGSDRWSHFWVVN